MLLASSRLEKAREVDELRGSFLTKHMCALLGGDDRSTVSVLDLSVRLRRAAEEHNGSSKQSVPFPYLSGDMREPILLKSPRTPGPVHIHLKNLHSLESQMLFAELAPYDHWNATNLLNELPIYLHWSELAAKRLEVIQQYLDTDTWPCEVEDRTREQFRSLLNRVVEAKSSIEHGVRVACAAAADANGANLRSQRNSAMETFIEAKALALMRLLLAMRLHGELPDAWMPPLYWLDTSYSPRKCSHWTNSVGSE